MTATMAALRSRSCGGGKWWWCSSSTAKLLHRRQVRSLTTTATPTTTTSSEPPKAPPQSSSRRPSSRTLALSVHFYQPDLGMKGYEILSRATAFLLAVDPPEEEEEDDPTKSHYEKILQASQQRREDWKVRQRYLQEPAGGPRGRALTELGWLEYCPKIFRPCVHCMASSHVLEPWRWPMYYPQEWLKHVSLEHCAYSLEVFDFSAKTSPTQNPEPLAKFALNPYPIHHPQDYDVALLHLKSEESVLPQLQKLGVEVLHLRQDEKVSYLPRDETVYFEGFEIMQDSHSHKDELSSSKEQEEEQEDTRIFVPFTCTGKVIYASTERYLADTTGNGGCFLPEGVCGGPALDSQGKVCGIVEGIVPNDHKNKQVAGAASFFPSFQLRLFVDYAERSMLQHIMPTDMFDQVVKYKTGKEGFDSGNDDKASLLEEKMSPAVTVERMEEEAGRLFDKMVHSMRQHRSPEQVDAILKIIQRERKEVLEIYDRDGGDLDSIIAQVRARTWENQEALLATGVVTEEETKEKEEGLVDAEIVSSSSSSSDDDDDEENDKKETPPAPSKEES